MPNPSTPTLLLMVFRFLTPLRTSARMRFSGMPQRPKPPIIMVAPSGMSRIAWSELGITLFTDEIVKQSAASRHGAPGNPDLTLLGSVLVRSPARGRVSELVGALKLGFELPRAQ